MFLNSNRLDAFLSHLGVERNLSPVTIQSYQEDLRHFIAWLDDNGIDLKELKPEKLDDFLTLTAGQEPPAVATRSARLDRGSDCRRQVRGAANTRSRR